jgi:4-amino-4-deoxy-L-arabinose transferase-like glycosyltransferase
MGLYLLCQQYIAYLMYPLFALLLALWIVNYKTAARAFSKISRRTWLILLLIFFAGLILRLFVFPHQHIMYIDEPWYLEMAKNINQIGQPVACLYTGYEEATCYMPYKPVGWPFMLSLLRPFFGMSNYAAIYFSSVLGSLTILLAFLVSFLVFNERVALWAAFLLALAPLHIIWSNTAETNNAAVFFILLTMLSFFLYLRDRRTSTLLLLAITALFTLTIRYENVLIIPPLILGYLLLSKRYRLFEAAYPLIVIAMLSGVIYLTTFAFRFFWAYFFTIDFYYLKLFDFLSAATFHYVFLVLITAGLLIRDKADGNKLALLVTLFLVFSVFYLPFYNPIEGRMALVPLALAILLAAYSIERISQCTKSIMVTRYVFILFLIIMLGTASYRANAWVKSTFSLQKLETDTVSDLGLPQGSYVIAAYPTVLASVSNIKGIPTELAVRDSQRVRQILDKTDVYYFWDGFCTSKTIAREKASRDYCRKFGDAYNLTLIKTFGSNKYQFFLYQVAP